MSNKSKICNTLCSHNTNQIKKSFRHPILRHLFISNVIYIFLFIYLVEKSTPNKAAPCLREPSGGLGGWLFGWLGSRASPHPPSLRLLTPCQVCYFTNSHQAPSVENVPSFLFAYYQQGFFFAAIFHSFFFFLLFYIPLLLKYSCPFLFSVLP